MLFIRALIFLSQKMTINFISGSSGNFDHHKSSWWERDSVGTVRRERIVVMWLTGIPPERQIFQKICGFLYTNMERCDFSAKNEPIYSIAFIAVIKEEWAFFFFYWKL